MSYEPEQQNQDGAGDGAEGGEDLQAALGGGEMNFVTETKQPMNKGTLVVVGLLIACGAATYFMYVRSGPSAAVAAGDPNAEKTIGQFLDGSQKNVEQMRKMLQTTYQDSYEPKVMPTDQAVIDALPEQSGAAYATQFYRSVVAHHRRAIVMIDEYVAKAKRPDVKAMAERMRKDQLVEIEEFEKKSGG